MTVATMSHSRPGRRHAHSARVEIAEVAGSRVRRRIAVADAARLLLELRDRGVVGLCRGGEGSKHRTAALLTGNGVRDCLIIELLISAGDTHQRNDADRSVVIRHDALALEFASERCKRHAASTATARGRCGLMRAHASYLRRLGLETARKAICIAMRPIGISKPT